MTWNTQHFGVSEGWDTYAVYHLYLYVGEIWIRRVKVPVGLCRLLFLHCHSNHGRTCYGHATWLN